MSGEMRPSSQGRCSMVDNEGFSASSDEATLPEALDLVADVPNWSSTGYCARYGRLLDARWFAGMITDGQSKTMFGRRGIRHDTNIGTWEQCWS